MRAATPLARETWRSHLLALLAIARKDLLLFYRYPLNAALRVVEPIIWLAPTYLLGRSFAGPSGLDGFAAYTGTHDFVGYILIGTILANYVMSVFWTIGLSLKNEMDSGVLESNWLAPVPRPLFLVGRSLAGFAITTVNNALIVLLAWLVFGVQLGGDVLPALAVFVPMLIALYGFGFAFAALVLLMRDAMTLIDTASYLVMLLSGAQFPVQALPRALLPLSLALPLTYGLDLVRASLLGTDTLLPRPVEVAILMVAMILAAPAGYAVFALVERRCRRLGTLGLH